ncbi:isopentenyl-diphosphate delta-isomerase, partial [Aliivibrio salmonicida]
FIYQAELENGLSEHEQDYILLANTPDVRFELNPEEVSDIQWWSETKIKQTLAVSPTVFSVWFETVYSKVIQFLDKK